MTCASCTSAIGSAVSELPGIAEVVVNLLGSSATLTVAHADVVPKVVSAIEEVGYTAEVISLEPLQNSPSAKKPSRTDSQQEGPVRVELSVDGMTCASCVTTILGLLSGTPGVSEASVNLLGKSATALLTKRELAPQLKEAIDDAGYEAEVIGLHPVNEVDGEDLGPRTVSLRVDGMFCSHCPGKIMSALKTLEPDVTVDKPLTSHTESILTLTYTPNLPDLSIRTIIKIIEGAGEPDTHFTAAIYRPPSLEDRARYMQRREKQHIFIRALFSAIVAIPMLIIGVVYMTLVPSDNHVRKWLMEPIWAGNTSRGVWAMFFMATPVMFYSAGMFHRRSLREIYALWKRSSRTPIWKRFVRFGSMNLLVSSGVSVAYFASIALLALSASQSRSTTGQGDTTTYFDSVVFLTMFLLAGRFLEAFSKGHTADAITALGKLRPTSALLVVSASEAASLNELSPSNSSSDTVAQEHDPEKGNAESEEQNFASKPGTKVQRVDAELLEVGDVVRVLHGASPPADGTVVSGDGSAFDESSLTGESRLVKKQIGDKVFLGTINKAGVVDVRVDEIGGQTMLDHVVKVVREGQARRAPIERLVDIITGYFVPVVTALAIATWVIWLGLGLGGALPQSYLDIDVGGWAVWSLEFAIAVFVVACPCGIGLAAPTALLVGSGLAAKFGILARGGGEAFQEAAQLDVIVFDKTGTLTEGGDPKVTNAEVFTENTGLALTRNEILGVAMEIESASSHPLATAIRGYCEGNGAKPQPGSSIEETPGRGLKASITSLKCTAVIGNEPWMEQHHATVDGRISELLYSWKSEGKSVVLLAISPESASDFSIVAAFAVADPIRPEAKEVLSRLQAQGLGTWMISGDNAVTAKAVARSIGILETNVIAEVLPHEKAEKIQWLQQVGTKRPTNGLGKLFSRRRLNERCVVAMVGDGINDAPALTAADVGIAIGSGSDVAISSASFILVSSNLRSLLTLTDLSRTVFNRVKINFLWASVYNLVMIPIAAGVVYPAGHARLSPVWASLAMALSSVSVVCSSLLLRLYREPKVSIASQ
ncbi:heavy metal translocatin [Dichomitus squalens]|uniref:Heavy metal translocatin n=1 Tax=Dichomitus squalens TaxID=114155 RepID=A0A4Q9MYS2_9APHY|nr:heavy metal translocatin [Dichomitus squalens]